VVDAVRCAVEVQRGIINPNADTLDEERAMRPTGAGSSTAPQDLNFFEYFSKVASRNMSGTQATGCGRSPRRRAGRRRSDARPMPASCRLRPPPSAANSRLHRQRGSRQDGGSGSCRFARRQAQARQEELTVPGVAKRNIVRHDPRGNGAQLADDSARFVDPPHTPGAQAVDSRQCSMPSHSSPPPLAPLARPRS
jgi:hypothetical protein